MLLSAVFIQLKRPRSRMTDLPEAQVLNSNSTVRVTSKVAAVSRDPNFGGFPKLAQNLARSTGGRAFSDKVDARTFLTMRPRISSSP